MKDNNLKPIVKWVGGKRQLISKLMEYKPDTFNKYYEPFIGGGAFLFALRPNDFVINDHNKELINMYKVVKNSTNELLEILKKHQENNTKEYYLEIRALDREPKKFAKMSDIERAARLIYMLKVDFNGLYRVNKRGQFNVPYEGGNLTFLMVDIKILKLLMKILCLQQKNFSIIQKMKLLAVTLKKL